MYNYDSDCPTFASSRSFAQTYTSADIEKKHQIRGRWTLTLTLWSTFFYSEKLLQVSTSSIHLHSITYPNPCTKLGALWELDTWSRGPFLIWCAPQNDPASTQPSLTMPSSINNWFRRALWFRYFYQLYLFFYCYSCNCNRKAAIASGRSSISCLVHYDRGVRSLLDFCSGRSIIRTRDTYHRLP